LRLSVVKKSRCGKHLARRWAVENYAEMLRN
jgi:hypothetical protein